MPPRTSLKLGPGAFTIGGAERVTDINTTNADATITAPAGTFSAADVGAAITGAGIPALTTILSVTNSGSAEMSANATATAAGVDATIVGTHVDVEVQLKNCRVESSENVASGDDSHFLDGTSEAGDETATYRFTVAGNVQQDDLAVDGFIAFSWAKKGTEQPFTFRPRNDLERQVTGVCVPSPVTIGGDTKVKNASDFTFRGVGDFDLGDV